MNVKLLTEHHLGFLRLKGGCTGSSEFTLVKMPHCWKSFRISFHNKVYAAVTHWKCPSEMLPLNITSYVLIEKQE